MNRFVRCLAGISIVISLVACDSPSRTVQATSRQIAEFQANPDSTRQVAIEESLAKLDAQIEALEKKGDRVQADLFRHQADSLRADFQAAKMAKALNDARKAIQGIGDAFKEAGKTIGEAIKNSGTNQP